jgi:hypothetical protein
MLVRVLNKQPPRDQQQAATNAVMSSLLCKLGPNRNTSTREEWDLHYGHGRYSQTRSPARARRRQLEESEVLKLDVSRLQVIRAAENALVRG